MNTFDNTLKKNVRDKKGKSLLSMPDDFTVIDLETTGFDPAYDEIIEVAAIRIRNGNIVDSFTSLVKPNNDIDEFISKLTGISNEMLSNSPEIKSVLPQLISFINNDVIVGHNVNFDINFIYDNCQDLGLSPISNNFIDTMRMSRILMPELNHHRLSDLCEEFDCKREDAHRSYGDCVSTLNCYYRLKEIAIQKYGTSDNFYKTHSGNKSKTDLTQLTTDNVEFDESNPLFGKVCVFTGELSRMTRKEAAQIVVDLGGICGNGITKKTDFLILGTQDYSRINGEKSSKQRKAEEYKLSGLPIEIISENTFYDMIFE